MLYQCFLSSTHGNVQIGISLTLTFHVRHFYVDCGTESILPHVLIAVFIGLIRQRILLSIEPCLPTFRKCVCVFAYMDTIECGIWHVWHILYHNKSSSYQHFWSEFCFFLRVSTYVPMRTYNFVNLKATSAIYIL